MQRDHNIVEHLVEKKTVIEKIKLMMDNLTTIKDTGEYLLHFDEVVVDDKSWNVWNWPQGVGLFGIFKYYQLTKDEVAFKIVTDWFERQFDIGAPPKNINTMAPLLVMAYLYEETQDSRYLPYLENWSEWAMNQLPRTQEGGFEHLTYGPENVEQLWDDTLMMTVLPLAKIGMLLGRKDYVEEAKRQFMIHAKYLQDRKTGLWYHGWTFEGHHHYAEALWARGNCWITIAIPEIIEILNLQSEDALHQFLVSTLQTQIEALMACQDVSGLWTTLLDDPNSYVESSATAGFIYGILKSIRKGYVSIEYLDAIEQSVAALIEQIDEKGEVQNVSVGTGMGPDLDFYRNIAKTAMPYGQSLSVLALTEYLYTFI